MNTGYLKTIGAGMLYLLSAPVFGEDQLKPIVISTNGSSFVAPLLERWTEEYKRERPGVTFVVTDQTEDAALTVLVSDGNRQSDSVAFAGRYALVPVSSSKNPFLKRISRGLSKRDVKYILFERDLLDEDEDGDKADKYPFNVYSRISKNGGTAATLAHFFDAKPGRIKGKKLYGDERYLLNILRKDSVAFVYTGLDNVYDMRTRQLKSGLSLVSLNVRSKQKERLYSGDVDHVLNLLENEPVEQIPVVRFGFAAGQDSRREVADFIRWVLERGQQYNHALGFLELDQQTLETQKSRVGEGFVSYRDR